MIDFQHFVPKQSARRSPTPTTSSPRLYVAQGANDSRVVQAESGQIVEKLRARGVEVRYDLYPGVGHVFTDKRTDLRVWSSVAEFLCTHLLAD